MKAHGWLRHVSTRTSGSVGRHRAPSEPQAGTVRAWATRGAIALALGLGSLGVAASVAGHDSTGHHHGSTHQPARSPAHSANAGPTGPLQPNRLPWMF